MMDVWSIHLILLLLFFLIFGEGSGTPLQYSCLENPMDGGAWWAAVHGVARSRTQLSDFTFTFHFHALEKAMATHSSVLAWRIPGTEEPGGLPSLGLHRVRHDWSDLAAVAARYTASHHSFSASCGDRAGITSKAWFFAHLLSDCFFWLWNVFHCGLPSPGLTFLRAGLWLLGRVVLSCELSPHDLFYSWPWEALTVYHSLGSKYSSMRILGLALKIKPFQEVNFHWAAGWNSNSLQRRRVPLNGLLALS